MLIAFEGPDETGKSTSAASLSHNGEPVYNATKANHAATAADLANEPELVQTFDRIDWLTHMIYRLAMPGHDWNDDRPRTVFHMPDTHLVIKIHDFELVESVEAVGEGYAPGRLVRVNQTYAMTIDWLMWINQAQEFGLFKTISVMQVSNDKTGSLHSFTQRLVLFNSPLQHDEMPEVTSDSELLELLRREDQQRI